VAAAGRGLAVVIGFDSSRPVALHAAAARHDGEATAAAGPVVAELDREPRLEGAATHGVHHHADDRRGGDERAGALQRVVPDHEAVEQDASQEEGVHRAQ
jgi:hypothetical protein